MTCRERLHKEHPELARFAKDLMGVELNHFGCPHTFKYAEKPFECDPPRSMTITCVECWNREAEEK